MKKQRVWLAQVNNRYGGRRNKPPLGWTTIYVLVHPLDGEIRYAGKTTLAITQRVKCHLGCKAKSRVYQWIKSLKKQGLVPGIVALDVVKGDGSAAERGLIAELRKIGARLVNHADGGGRSGGGWKLSEETKQRLRQLNTGKRLAPETIEKIRQAALIQWAEGRGPDRSDPVWRAKVSRALKGRKFSEERKAGLRGRVLTPEHKLKLRLAKLGRKLTDEHKHKIGLAVKRTGRTEQHEDALKASQDVEWRRKLSVANRGQKRSPEQKVRISEGLKLAWQRRKGGVHREA